MAYRSKKEALASVKERRHQKHGREYIIYEVFLGYDVETGKQKRLSSLTKKGLQKKIADFYEQMEAGGVAATTFTQYEASDARRALDLLEQYKAGLTLVDCVRKVLDGKCDEAQCTVTVRDAYEKFMAAQMGKSHEYVRGLKNHVGRWADEFGRDRLLSEITAQEVVAELKKRIVDEKDQKTWKTYNNHIGDIKTFVGWCAKPEQKFIAESPLKGVSNLQIAYREPEYVKAEDVAKLFMTMEKHREDSPHDLAYAILSFFCGMRQSEIVRVKDGDGSVKIDIAEGFVRVVKVKGTTRGVRPRAFRLSEQALAWMRSFDFMTAIKMPNTKFRVHMVKFAKEAGIKLPQNAGRHTFITMHAAAYHDPNLLSSLVGNTEGVRANSYDGVEVERNGKAYFEIMPRESAV